MNSQSHEQRIRVNYDIRVPMVRVTQDGRQLGVMPLRDAQRLASEAYLDLVEIVPHAKPPVCQIMDYGKYKFDQSRQKKQSKKNQKQCEMKEIQVRPVTGEHDLETKVAALRRFVAEGRVVQVTCLFSKREVMFKDQGFEVLRKIAEAVKDVATQEAPPKFNQKRIQCRFRPGKETK